MIERILGRSLTFDELNNLVKDRFDYIRRILQRPLTEDELLDLLKGNPDRIMPLIEEGLDRQKEEELRALPIDRIRYFERILSKGILVNVSIVGDLCSLDSDRKLSSHELLRFADDRFGSLSRLLSDVMKPEQILDIASGHHDKIEAFFNRPLTNTEQYRLARDTLQSHVKYADTLEEMEHLTQRRLSEQELRRLADGQFDDLEKRLGKPLNETQLRNLLHGHADSSLTGGEDLVEEFRRKYEDNRARTRKVVARLVETLDESHANQERDSLIVSTDRPSIVSESPVEKSPELKVAETTSELLRKLSGDLREYGTKTPRDSVDDRRPSSLQELPLVPSDNDSIDLARQSLDDEKTSEASPSSPSSPAKAFQSSVRLVEHIVDAERLEDRSTITNAMNILRPRESTLPSTERSVKRSPVVRMSSHWLPTRLPAIKPPDTTERIQPPQSSDGDLYLGWTSFKWADRQDLGLREETPRLINVKHTALTYVVGIPEDYADDKSQGNEPQQPAFVDSPHPIGSPSDCREDLSWRIVSRTTTEISADQRNETIRHRSIPYAHDHRCHCTLTNVTLDHRFDFSLSISSYRRERMTTSSHRWAPSNQPSRKSKTTNYT